MDYKLRKKMAQEQERPLVEDNWLDKLAKLPVARKLFGGWAKRDREKRRRDALARERGDKANEAMMRTGKKN